MTDFELAFLFQNSIVSESNARRTVVLSPPPMSTSFVWSVSKWRRHNLAVIIPIKPLHSSENARWRCRKSTSSVLALGNAVLSVFSSNSNFLGALLHFVHPSCLSYPQGLLLYQSFCRSSAIFLHLWSLAFILTPVLKGGSFNPATLWGPVVCFVTCHQHISWKNGLDICFHYSSLHPLQ